MLDPFLSPNPREFCVVFFIGLYRQTQSLSQWQITFPPSRLIAFSLSVSLLRSLIMGLSVSSLSLHMAYTCYSPESYIFKLLRNWFLWSCSGLLLGLIRFLSLSFHCVAVSMLSHVQIVLFLVAAFLLLLFSRFLKIFQFICLSLGYFCCTLRYYFSLHMFFRLVLIDSLSLEIE